jgi:hypothetical protein
VTEMMHLKFVADLCKNGDHKGIWLRIGRPVTGSWEHGNEPSGSLKGEDILK